MALCLQAKARGTINSLILETPCLTLAKICPCQHSKIAHQALRHEPAYQAA